jgi:hypothetical protein
LKKWGIVIIAICLFQVSVFKTDRALPKFSSWLIEEKVSESECRCSPEALISQKAIKI